MSISNMFTDISVRKKIERAKAKLKKYFEEETND